MIEITIFGKLGGSKEEVLLMPYIDYISKTLEKVGTIISIEPNIQLHIEYRIDGDLVIYDDPLGCSHMRFMKKKNVIANTIAITYDFLKESTLGSLKLFLKENFVLAISQMLDRLEKEKYILDKEFILNILEKELEGVDTK